MDREGRKTERERRQMKKIYKWIQGKTNDGKEHKEEGQKDISLQSTCH
jgi:hypothetical protein